MKKSPSREALGVTKKSKKKIKVKKQRSPFEFKKVLSTNAKWFKKSSRIRTTNEQQLFDMRNVLKHPLVMVS